MLVAELSSAAAAAMTLYIVGGVTLVSLAIVLAVYMYYRQGQRLEATRLELTDRAHAREHNRMLTEAGLFDLPRLPVPDDSPDREAG